MYKKILFFLALFSLNILPFSKTSAETLAEKLQGRILLQVEQNGEAWFISPQTQKRYFLGRPTDAFEVMRNLGLGISNADFDKFENDMPDRLLGQILLKVQDSGKAYYINPLDKKAYFLGRPADAFEVMRNLGLGITDASLNQIEEDAISIERRQNQEQKQNQGEEQNQEQNTNNNASSSEAQKTNKETATSTEETATSTEVIATSTKEILTGSKSCEFKAEYFKKDTISGYPSYTETITGGIDFNWGAGSPEILGDYNNRFSIRYTGECYFEAGKYEFTAVVNDGVEAKLDNYYWLTRSWKNRTSAQEINYSLKIDEGYHTVTVEYYDNIGDAQINFDWEKIE